MRNKNYGIRRNRDFNRDDEIRRLSEVNEILGVYKNTTRRQNKILDKKLQLRKLLYRSLKIV